MIKAKKIIVAKQGIITNQLLNKTKPNKIKKLKNKKILEYNRKRKQVIMLINRL